MPKTKVLVVEDDRSLVDVLTYNLKLAGYEVIVSTDGQDGILQAQLKQPDIVLLDLMIPVVDGLDVCRRLRSHYRTRHIPILMLTAKATEDDKLEGLGGGANDYVVKPWNKRELVQRVCNHLEWAPTQKAVNGSIFRLAMEPLGGSMGRPPRASTQTKTATSSADRIAARQLRQLLLRCGVVSSALSGGFT